MNKKTLAAVTLASMTLSNCVITSGSYDEICAPVRAVVPGHKHITYSVNINQEHSNKTMKRSQAILHDHFIMSIKDELLSSNMFASATYTSTPQQSRDHYHFDIYIHSPGKGKAELLGFVHGLSLFMLPVWYTQNIDVKITAYGKTFMTEQYARTYHWAPLLLAAPFANGETLAQNISKRSVSFFLTEIEKRNLHK